jgi:hypothetical protein
LVALSVYLLAIVKWIGQGHASPSASRFEFDDDGVRAIGGSALNRTGLGPGDVIWAPSDSKADVTKLGWKALLSESVQKIAIANPEHAP